MTHHNEDPDPTWNCGSRYSHAISRHCRNYIQSFVVDKVNQLSHNPDALTRRPDCGQRCYALLVGIFLKKSYLVSKVNTLGIMTGLFSFSAGFLSSAYILLRKIWDLGFLACLAGVASILFGSGALTYAFVTEHDVSHISLKDFLVSSRQASDLFGHLTAGYCA